MTKDLGRVWIFICVFCHREGGTLKRILSQRLVETGRDPRVSGTNRIYAHQGCIDKKRKEWEDERLAAGQPVQTEP